MSRDILALPIRDLRGIDHIRCGKRHRTFSAVAKCRWPRNVWITGDGPYATVSYCRGNIRPRDPFISVMLHETEEAARKAMETIDRLGCGGGCDEYHRLYMLTDNEGLLERTEIPHN